MALLAMVLVGMVSTSCVGDSHIVTVMKPRRLFKVKLNSAASTIESRFESGFLLAGRLLVRSYGDRRRGTTRITLGRSPSEAKQVFEITGIVSDMSAIRNSTDILLRFELGASETKTSFSRLDIHTGRIQPLPASLLNLQPGSIEFSPTGDSVALVPRRGNPNILVASSSGRRKLALPVAPSQGAYSPTWSGDGRRIAYSVLTGKPGENDPYRDRELWITDLETGRYRCLLSTGNWMKSREEGFSEPSWAPSGPLIAAMEKQEYKNGKGLRDRIIVVDSMTGKYQPITGWDNFLLYGWSESGDGILYLTEEEVGGATYVEVMKVPVRYPKL